MEKESILEYDHVNISDVPRYKSQLAAYYGYATTNNFNRAYKDIFLAEFKRLRIRVVPTVHSYTPNQLKIIVGILGRN